MSLTSAIFKAIFAAANFFTALFGYLKQNQDRKAGENRAAARSLKEQMIRVRKARAARRAVDIDSVPDDDPYLRD